ncbi:MAG TPA: hypothetical protein DDW50_13640 [Firmicutes bacterium]|jgi:hypothetical protein|nr:hypothetical protein [Bacillota bacterium]
MNFKWKQIGEKFYDIIAGEKIIGVLYWLKNNQWILNIPDLNIYREDQTYKSLMQYAEIQLN